MKPAVIRRVLQKSLFTALGESVDTTALGLQALVPVLAEFIFIIHLKGLLLITQQRNKHCLCQP